MKKECDKVWKEALQLSMAESSQASLDGNQADALSSTASSLREVDIKAVAKACRSSEIPRRCAASPSCLVGTGSRHLSQTLLVGGALPPRVGGGRGRAGGGEATASCEQIPCPFAALWDVNIPRTLPDPGATNTQVFFFSSSASSASQGFHPVCKGTAQEPNTQKVTKGTGQRQTL